MNGGKSHLGFPFFVIEAPCFNESIHYELNERSDASTYFDHFNNKFWVIYKYIIRPRCQKTGTTSIR